MNQYIAGDVVTVTAAFQNAVSAPADPTSVVLKIGRKYTAPTTYTYGVGSVITKTGTGNYSGNIDTTGFAQGQYTYEWIGTGVVQAVNYGVFAVITQPI